MKLLFITTYKITIHQEHFFTKAVFEGLVDAAAYLDLEVCLLSILLKPTITAPQLNELVFKGVIEYQLNLPITYGYQPSEIIIAVENAFEYINPDVIHSNMVEGYDGQAALSSSIPYVQTIHIGGYICPRGGGNGLLNFENRICPTYVNHKECIRCCSQDLPGKDLLYYVLRLIPLKLRLKAYHWMNKKSFIYFITPALQITGSIENALQRISIFKKNAAIIVANNQLKNILETNDIKDNLFLLPHGVKERIWLSLPEFTDGKVKFYFVGRVQYAKGLHLLIRSLHALPIGAYEFHIVGDAEPMRKEQRYYRKVVRMSKGLPVIFHGRKDNEELESLVKFFHVMVHPAIFLEIFGIAIAEALSMGRPVLATRCGGPEMQVTEHVNGWLIEPNSINQFKEALKHILDNKEEIVHYAANCSIPPFKQYIEGLKDIYEYVCHETK